MNFPFLPVAIRNLFSKPSTVPFPKVNVDAKPNYRGRIAYDATKCIGCGLCMKVCSPSAIEKAVEEVENGQNITLTFNLTSCTFCGTCADFCAKKAITLTDDYHMVATDVKDLMVTGTFFKENKPKPQFTPEQLAKMKADAAAKAAAKAANKTE